MIHLYIPCLWPFHFLSSSLPTPHLILALCPCFYFVSSTYLFAFVCYLPWNDASRILPFSFLYMHSISPLHMSWTHSWSSLISRVAKKKYNHVLFKHIFTCNHHFLSPFFYRNTVVVVSPPLGILS